jgi:NAD(P)-dependent dehydrogenase (short-subunit alcohol dehydrogenase family)
MVALSDVQEANELTFSHRPYVAVFVGATSGIGEYTIAELARQLSRNNHEGSCLYLIGRNATAGDRITKECKTNCPGIEIIWIKAQDLALLADVDRICQGIRHHEKRRCVDREPQIDLLFMTQGKLDFGDRSGTCHRSFIPTGEDH